MNKYKAKKIDGFDSKLERDHYLSYKMLENTGLIKDLKKLDRKDDCIELLEGFKVKSSATKTGIQSIQSIKYTPDFSFIAIGLTMFEKDRKVFVEVKSKMTKKLSDYSLRKRLFLDKCIKNNWGFIEITGSDFVYFN